METQEVTQRKNMKHLIIGVCEQLFLSEYIPHRLTDSIFEWQAIYSRNIRTESETTKTAQNYFPTKGIFLDVWKKFQ